LGVRACFPSASGPAFPRRPGLFFLGVRACFFSEFRAAVSSEFRFAFLRIPALSFRQLRRILSRPNFLLFVLFCAAYVVSLYDIPAGKIRSAQ
ncbi:MAG: hypothetical protein ACLUNN_08440, partial [Alistipes finegoldii]